MTRHLMITVAAIGLVASGGAAFASNEHVNPNHPHHGMKDVIIHPPKSAHDPHMASTHLKYDDDDLATPESTQALLGRINVAAKKVCAPAPRGPSPLAEKADYKRCLKDATEEAVQGVNSPALTDAYKSKS